MSQTVIAHYVEEGTIREGKFKIDTIPDSCPTCHKGIEPIKRFKWFEEKHLYLIFQCPKKVCRVLFIAHYSWPLSHISGPYSGVYDLISCGPWKVEKATFPEEVVQISKKFFEIYNQAKEAEERGLKEICGAGYRKALEFLIKDYLKKEKIAEPEIIEKTSLSNCIKEHVKNDRIKTCAKRAAWLGNDETHYTRKWGDKDLPVLKNLIQLTVNWIYDEHLTREIEKDMPEKKTKK